MLLIPAHAKINLCLAVRRRRPDGFHDIDSVAVTIDWHDLLGIRAHPAKVTAVRLRVTGDTGDVPPGESNLVVQAARAVAAANGPMDVDLWLDKHVPSEAGLGGGSADAAAVLRGCRSLIGVDSRSTREMAAALGSDVPMLLSGGAQRMRGRGELLTALSAPALHLAVAIAGRASTAAAYGGVQPFDLEDADRIDDVVAALDSGERPDDDLLGSGLERAATAADPQLDERLTALRAAVSEAHWHLTGSGGGAFAIAEDGAHAAGLAAAADAAGFMARACRTLSG